LLTTNESAGLAETEGKAERSSVPEVRAEGVPSSRDSWSFVPRHAFGAHLRHDSFAVARASVS